MVTAAQKINIYNHAIPPLIERTVKQLVETKHLYQNTKIDFEELLEKHVLGLNDHDKGVVLANVQRGEIVRWINSSDVEEMTASSLRVQQGIETYPIIWKTPDVKLYCTECNRVEAYNALQTKSVLPSKNGEWKSAQIYTVIYLCQSCKKTPEVFLLRRTGNRLQIAGRTPMEHTPVPSVIPERIRKLYSDAIIAFQSGQVLAGLFLLRCTCEQWVRQYGAQDDKADQAIDKYMAGLPAGFSDNFPSIRLIYSNLSAVIHAAEASTQVFEQSVQQISEHFDARRLFKLTDVPTPIAVAQAPDRRKAK